MQNKVVITGGAGFIGSFLINKIKNKKDLLVVDKIKNKKILNKFKQLKIKYITGDLTNKKFSKKVYKNANLVYHLAGDVKVPNTEINLNQKKEKKIFFEAIKIMENLILFCNRNTRVIFPSTHLIFEKCKKNKQIFHENSKPLANLAYSRSKLKCEELLKSSGLNFSILRLGSVYGQAENKKRMFNLPNLFPLRVKNNLDLKLFSKGIQIKAIISVNDVVNAMVFLSSKKKKGLYHLVSEHLTVKKIATICKNFNPKTNLILTNDPIPYQGYYMNCQKIINLGFNFSFTYKDFVKQYLFN